MRLPSFILAPLSAWLIGRLRAGKGAPHRHGDISNAAGELYMARRWLIQPHWWTLGCGARIHHTVRGDRDRALHSHPWWNISLILGGWYYEEMPVSAKGAWIRPLSDGSHHEAVTSARRMPGDIVFRRAVDRHRLALPANGECYSLFIMGPYERVWGFMTEKGEVERRTYLGLPPKEDGETH